MEIQKLRHIAPQKHKAVRARPAMPGTLTLIEEENRDICMKTLLTSDI